MCHILLLLPFIAPVLFLFLPLGQALPLYALILLISGILYWLIWKDMRRPVATGIEGMVGEVANVIQNKSKTAKVFYKGEIWEANCDGEIRAGEAVEIEGVEGMRLVVRKVMTKGTRQTCH